MTTIPASQLANVNPSVIGAGGSGLDITAIVLTKNVRVPIGTVAQFSTGAAVSSFFGSGSNEAVIANGGVGKGTGYFGGFTGSNKKPGVLLFTQYPQSAVNSYLRGGNISALTLTQLQALSGTLNVVMDGVTRNGGTINLSSASSFSNAATTIQTALNSGDPTIATVTASIGATFTGSQSGINLTTTSTVGLISVGDTISGTGVASGTKIVSQTSGSTGGNGVYVTSLSGTASTASCVASSNVLNITNIASGVPGAGQYIVGAGVTSATIASQATGGAGGVGTYVLGGLPQQVASESMTTQGTPVTVTYDSTSGAFVVTSGITGVLSTAAFATGTISAGLLLTSATGAVLSQGAAAAVPAAFMNALIVVNQNWVNFMTAFDPDSGSGNSVKQAFAAWKNSQNNRYGYVCFDTDVTPTNTLPATNSLGYILANDNDSGTCLIFEPSDLNHAAFICGTAASIDFTQTNGRTTFSNRIQAGLVAAVSDPVVATNLGGNPQVANDRGNGYNFVGAYANANTNRIWFQRGFVTGPYLWFDSYINQIWLNNAFQNNLLDLQQNAKSIPYTINGASLIDQALAPTIAAGLNFGAFGPGTLSASEIAAVNQAAGVNVAGNIQTQGYYLQVLPGAPDVRAARTSPPCTFWYLDNGSVQAINLNSIALQ